MSNSSPVWRPSITLFPNCHSYDGRQDSTLAWRPWRSPRQTADTRHYPKAHDDHVVTQWRPSPVLQKQNSCYAIEFSSKLRFSIPDPPIDHKRQRNNMSHRNITYISTSTQFHQLITIFNTLFIVFMSTIWTQLMSLLWLETSIFYGKSTHEIQ